MGMANRTISSSSLGLSASFDKDDSRIYVMNDQTRKYVIAIITATILGLVLGVIIGNVSVSRSTDERMDDISERLKFFDRLVDVPRNHGRRDSILSEVSADSINAFLKDITKTPRMAGTQSAQEFAGKMKQMWIDHGIPNVQLASYEVLLSYPDGENPSSVAILNSNNEVLFETEAQDFTNLDLDRGTKISPPFNAYSGSGTVTGDLVYLRSGRMKDFTYVTENLGIDLEGKILLIRYGGRSRGQKAMMAQKFNASGVIFYSDPQNYASTSKYYPDNLNLPPSGVQRGSLSRIRSDILTPGYPATASAYRISVDMAEERLSFPKIPVFPIAYADAEKLIREIDGFESPAEWRGALNASYKIGPGLKDNKQVRLKVGNIKAVKVINNIIGTIPGSIEPDRYVIVGNHRDSWTYGGSDPGSATACLVELTRVFGKLYKEGWRPRRTLIFASWDGEESGYIGSSEWLEENKAIMDRTVTYMNIDQAVTDTLSFTSRATPSLHDILYNITKQIKNPNDTESARGRKFVYDTWVVQRPSDSSIHPKVGLPSGGSDFYPFNHHLGISAIDFRYCGKRLSNPLYHTRFETYDMQANIIDPQFKYHKTVTQIWAMTAHAFLEPLILPFNMTAYIPVIRTATVDLKEAYGEMLQLAKIKLDNLDNTVQELFETLKKFEEKKSRAQNSKDPFLIRWINDQMMAFERSFISIESGTNRKTSNNVVLSYALESPTSKRLLFGPLCNTLWEVKLAQEKQLDSVRKQISILIYHLKSANLVLH